MQLLQVRVAVWDWPWNFDVCKTYHTTTYMRVRQAQLSSHPIRNTYGSLNADYGRKLAYDRTRRSRGILRRCPANRCRILGCSMTL